MQTIERPPVRYSIGQDDYDHNIGRRLRICLDGEEQDMVIEYDCEAGTLTRQAVDPVTGSIMLTPQRDEVVRETVTGNVTVEWKD